MEFRKLQRQKIEQSREKIFQDLGNAGSDDYKTLRNLLRARRDDKSEHIAKVMVHDKEIRGDDIVNGFAEYLRIFFILKIRNRVTI